MEFAAERLAQTNATSRSINRLNDGSLVLRAKNEQSTAFATLSDQYKEQLFRFAHRITRTREDAEDAVQDTLLRAFVHMGDFEGRSSFGTWMTRITINSALMILRRKRTSLEIAIGRNNDSGGDDLCCEITDHAPSRGSDSSARTFARGNRRSIRHLSVSSQRTTISRQEGASQVLKSATSCVTRRRSSSLNCVPETRTSNGQQKTFGLVPGSRLVWSGSGLKSTWMENALSVEVQDCGLNCGLTEFRKC